MTKTVEELMDATLRIFAERDEATRRALLADAYAETIAFTDPEGTITGRDAINDRVGAMLNGAPDAHFRARGPVRVSAELGYLGWSFGMDGEPSLVEGLDIAIVEHGQIARLHTFIEKPPTHLERRTMSDQHLPDPNGNQPPKTPDDYLAEIDVEEIRAADQPAHEDEEAESFPPATSFRRPVPGGALSDEQLANDLESDAGHERS